MSDTESVKSGTITSPSLSSPSVAHVKCHEHTLFNFEKVANDNSPHSQPRSELSHEPLSLNPSLKSDNSLFHNQDSCALADNPDIAFIVMFRSRFHQAFPPKLIHLGPQDMERGAIDIYASSHIENLLCALLTLVLNRKKPIEKSHYNRALEEAIISHKSEWLACWNGEHPLAGNRTFLSLSVTERLSLLKALILWSLHSSDAISQIVKESYKQARREGDLNQPLSVQPWGRDGLKRRYWLIEGQDDTPFRLYRESDLNGTQPTWKSIAGSVRELRDVAQQLQCEPEVSSQRLAARISVAIQRFELTEEKRKRREYRMMRKVQSAKNELAGFSLYEGRTRGKRLRYTFSDGETDVDNEGNVATEDATLPLVSTSGRPLKRRYDLVNRSSQPYGTPEFDENNESEWASQDEYEDSKSLLTQSHDSGVTKKLIVCLKLPEELLRRITCSNF